MWKKLTRWIYDRPLEDGAIVPPRYKIEQCFGSGGYGIVYLCKDVHSLESYALKQLRPSKARKAKEIARFREEIELLEKIQHRQIPGLIYHSITEERAFYVMQLVEGVNLEEKLFIEKQTFTEQEALMIFSELLKIVESLHDRLIFHTDIRPPNMIVRGHEVFLIDFGLAKTVSPEDQEELRLRRQDDFFDLGETLLFMLYSEFKGKTSKKKSWLEELTMKKETKRLIKRLLGIDPVFDQAEDIRNELNAALQAVKVKQ